MQVTKLRTEDNGLVPAGRYFARLATNLREQNEHSAATLARGEDRERKLEARYRRATRTSARVQRDRQEELRLS